MEIIRKELTPLEVSPANLRYNSTTDRIQKTLDGGATWINSPLDDPRHNPANLIPLRTGSSVQCDSAANMVAAFKKFIDKAISDLYIGQYIVDALQLVAAIFLELGVVADIVLAAFSLLYDVGAGALSSTCTAVVYQTITNILFCDIGPDGSVSAAQLARINADILAQLGSTVAVIWGYVMTGLGEVGLQNAGSQGSVVGSCSGTGCEKSHYIDFRVAPSDGYMQGGASGPYGTYIAGVGFIAADVSGQSAVIVVVDLLLASSDYLIDNVTAIFKGSYATPAGSYQQFTRTNHAGVPVGTALNRTPPVNNSSWTDTTPATIQHVALWDVRNTTGQRQQIVGCIVTWHNGALAPAYPVNYP